MGSQLQKMDVEESWSIKIWRNVVMNICMISVICSFSYLSFAEILPHNKIISHLGRMITLFKIAVFVDHRLNTVVKAVVMIMAVDGVGNVVSALAVFAVALAPLFHLVKLVGILKCIAVKMLILRHFPNFLSDLLQPASTDERAPPLSARAKVC